MAKVEFIRYIIWEKDKEGGVSIVKKMAGKKRTIDIKKLNLAGLFIALGVIIPYFAGHAFGIEGVVFLPMHIPVLMAGLLLGWRYGAIVGVLAPILSSLLTGMPALWPQLPMLGSELIIFGLVAGLVREKFKWNLYVSLIVAMIAGRVIGAGVLALVLAPPNINVFIGMVTGRLTTGLPGIGVQLVFIPGLVMLIERAFGKIGESEGVNSLVEEGRESITVEKKDAVEEVEESGETKEMREVEEVKKEEDKLEINNITQMKDYKMNLVGFEENREAIHRAVAGIEAGDFGCAVIKNNVIIHEGRGKGVSPLLELASTVEGLKKMENALVVDRIIGKAAAMLVVMGKVTHAYGLTMSKSGEEYLHAHGVETKNNRCVDAISDRTGRGICPMERSVMEIDDPREGFEKLQETLAYLRSKSS